MWTLLTSVTQFALLCCNSDKWYSFLKCILFWFEKNSMSTSAWHLEAMKQECLRNRFLWKMLVLWLFEFALGWRQILECIYFTHFPLDWMLRSFKCIEISLSDQTPGAETLSKVCVLTNESRAQNQLSSHWSRHKL